MIIWSGLGILVPVIFCAAMWLMESLAGSAYYASHGWTKFVACAVAGLIVLALGSSINKDRPSGNSHSFFFIPVEVWGLIIFGFGIYASFAK